MSRFSLPDRDCSTPNRFGAAVLGGCLLWLCQAALAVAAVQGDDQQEPQQTPPAYYHTAIAEIESEFGPYAADLSEPLQGLAATLAQQGDYRGAGRAYRRAIHLTRINEGLYSSRQIPLLQALVTVDQSAGRWDRANDGYGHMTWLYRQAFSRGERLDYAGGLGRISDWHLAVVGLDAAAQRHTHLRRANEINQLALRAAQRQYGNLDDPRLVPVLYRLALSHYYLALALARDVKANALLRESDLQRVPRDRSGLFENRIDTDTAEVNRHLQSGRQALQRIQSIYGQSLRPTAAQAEAMTLVYLADWELLSARVRSFTRSTYLRGSVVRQSISYGSVKKAVQQYNGAHRQLLALGLEPAALRQFFSRPAALPAPVFSPLPDTPAGPGDSESSPGSAMQFVSWVPALRGVSYPGASLLLPTQRRLVQATASLDVDALGRAARIEFTQRDDGVRIPSRAREEIKAIQFRPAIVDEAATRSSAVTLHYKFSSG
ncbi:hypothetical protein FKG94_21535 [Exilibacterium tricleocarpae]|uniref:Tetratricopeptide repeat protein n=1 Tax=Exilibacterium tricleocarpae TaxID=2591008 RepID=A0A545SYT1_9GAMM|nr:hypothetical protein [Exilibacterium tricleocarpae]TQV70112.1 hypothetical protein FKG94_21535 [Exilibacterium tricleocarpae]